MYYISIGQCYSRINPENSILAESLKSLLVKMQLNEVLFFQVKEVYYI